MSNRYVVKSQSGLGKDGKRIERGVGVWDTKENKWINNHTFLDNSKGKATARKICHAKNMRDNA